MASSSFRFIQSEYGACRRLFQWGRRLALAVLATISLAEFATSNAQAATIQLVAFGDSLSAGYLLPADAAFPAVLEKALRAKGISVEVANAAVSGDTSSGGLQRLDWAIDDKTRAVILELGANDMLRGLDPALTRDALDAIITKLKARGIRVLIAGMRASPGLGQPYQARFDAIYPELAAKHGAILYPFFLEGIAADPRLNLPDGMHPNRLGVEKIVAGILPSVEALLKEIR